MVLVGNKCDLTDERELTPEDGIDVSRRWNKVPFYETSALYRMNVEDAFVDVVRQIIRKEVQQQQQQQQKLQLKRANSVTDSPGFPSVGNAVPAKSSPQSVFAPNANGGKLAAPGVLYAGAQVSSQKKKKRKKWYSKCTHYTKPHKKTGHRTAPASKNFYLSTLVRLYSYLARKYQSI